MNHKTSLATVTAVAALLATSAPASATTFCVPSFHAGCPDNGTNVAEPSVEAAMSTSGSDGIADTVLIGTGTFTDTNSINPSGSDPLTVRGAGAGQTELTTSSTGNIYVLNLDAGGNGRLIDVHDLTVVAPASLPDNLGAAVQVSGDTLEDVDIEIRNPGTSALPSWPGGGSFHGGRIYATGAGSVGTGIRANSTATVVTIEEATIEGAVGAITNAGATQPMEISRVRVVDPGQTGLVVSAGSANVENSVFDQSGTTALYAFAGGAADVEIDADHVTIAGDGSGNSAAIVSQVGAGNAGDATVSVRSSIVRGHAYSYLREAPVGGATGDAALTFAYTNRDGSALATDSGDGTTDLSVGNTTADPQLAADLSLPAGSPSIDAADPASTLTTDLLGAPRPVDGDAVAGAVADQGAFEYQPPVDPDPDPDPPSSNPDTTPPDTIAGRGPKRRSAKRKATFRFSSESGATFTCRLDGGAPKPCTSPAKVRRLKRGRHRFEVAAIDAAGNADPTPTTFRFRVVRKR